jgi:hypothetical protein
LFLEVDVTELWDSISGVGSLLVLAIVSALAIRAVRRWFKDADLPVTSGFTMSELRKIYQEGKMTKAEFEKATERVCAAHSAHFLPSEKTNSKTEKAGDRPAPQ